LLSLCVFDSFSTFVAADWHTGNDELQTLLRLHMRRAQHAHLRQSGQDRSFADVFDVGPCHEALFE